MSGRSRKSRRKTSRDTTAATSSTASPGGSTPAASPGGTDLFGQPLSPASPSARRGKGKASKTSGTSGRSSFGSSASAALTLSLGNRLLQTTDTDGSMEYELTWSRSATPSGLLSYRLRASARPTSGNGCSGLLDGWATPTSHERTFTPRDVHHGQQLANQAHLTGWPTPDAQDFGGGDSRWEERREEIKAKAINGNGFGLTLGMAATLARLNGESSRSVDSGPDASGPPKADTPKPAPEGSGGIADLLRGIMAGWATPTVNDTTGVGTTERYKRMKEDGHQPSLLKHQAILAGWGTPSARDHKDDGPAFEADSSIVEVESRLPWQAALAGWATPAATDGTKAPPDHHGRNLTLVGQALTSGPIGILFCVATRTTRIVPASGVLSAAHSRWLQGFPETWDHCSPGWREWLAVQEAIASGGCAATETPSTPSAPPTSSEQ